MQQVRKMCLKNVSGTQRRIVFLQESRMHGQGTSEMEIGLIPAIMRCFVYIRPYCEYVHILSMQFLANRYYLTKYGHITAAMH